jgi:hypothetical protein
MSRVAALVRRRAARLPEDSPLRAELTGAAEYYAIGADRASTVPRVRRHDATRPDQPRWNYS